MFERKKYISQKWKAFVFSNIYLHQTFIDCVSYQYRYFDTFIGQMWQQVKENSLLAFLGIFIHYWRAFVSEVLYHHQTFTDCVSNYTFISSCQIRLQVSRYSDLIANFWNFHIFLHVWNVITTSNFCELYIKAEV